MAETPSLPQVVWLVRHAETARPTLLHGAESDVGLGDHGRRQAAAAADWFAAQRPTAVVSSAMTRARETAAVIAAACGVPHLLEPMLHERRVGPLSGQPRERTDPIWQETVRQWAAGNTAFTTPGAESFDDLRRRVVPAFLRTVTAQPGGRVVVVCHGMVCKVLLLSVLRDTGPADWLTLGSVPYLAVSRLVPDGDAWRAERLLEVPPPVAAVNAAAHEPNRGSQA